MELVPLDVQHLDQLKAFAAGCDILVHGGTPFQLDVEDPQRDLFDPTIKGTENFLRVVSETPSVKKVVFIASVAAVNTNFPQLPAGKAEGDTISEADPFYFSEENHPYAQAKFLANRVVDQFIANHPDPGFEITTVSPVGVMGMAMSKREDSTSMGIQFLFKNKIAPNPFIQMFYDLDVTWALVDVADVGEATYKAAITKNIHGKNYLLSSESYRISDISLMLNRQPPVGQPVLVYQNDLAKTDLGVNFRPLQATLAGFAG
jgi:nucleoside-diphosphate-sugar epimerase